MSSARNFAAALSWSLLGSAVAVPGVLSPLPPMGFNDWAQYMGGLNQSLFTDTADAMVAKGLLHAGYNRINLDDEWSTMERLPNGSMTWNTEKFPNGLPWLTQYLKDRGFMAGIYTDAGNKSCGGFPGAYGYEEIDAATFVSWGFDYLKLDGCNMPDSTEATYKAVYGKWHEIFSSMPNPMVFSESAPAYFASEDNLTDWYTVMDWVPQFGQLARHSQDILVWNSTNYWPDITGWDGVMNNYAQQVRLARFQRPGYVNDPDFLNVDHFDYTLDEKKSHFALWASFSAPLILSTDVLNMTDDEVAYLTNADIIAVDQDPLVQQATLVSQSADWDVLTKSLYNGDRLLTVLNKGNNTADLTVSWARIGLSPDTLATPSTLVIKDLWTGANTTVSVASSSGITAQGVPSHGTALFRLSNPVFGDSVRVYPTGEIFNTYTLSCLTAGAATGCSGGSSVTWANCTGGDGQVWRVRPEGTVSSLLDESHCLAEAADGTVAMVPCSDAAASTKWNYFISGNLINAKSGSCLTEITGEAPAYSEQCGYLTNEQVLALPVGVTL
ncbi:glycoside hydrolase superfamily [Xylariales sp. PMI_506]|nr:glycoside hydrolase superfamily [Xylariales sp. PMI_506]